MIIYLLSTDNRQIAACRPNTDQHDWLTRLSGYSVDSEANPECVRIDLRLLKETLTDRLVDRERPFINPPDFQGRTHDSNIPMEMKFDGQNYIFSETLDDTVTLFLLIIYNYIKKLKQSDQCLNVFTAKSPKEYRDYLRKNKESK